MVIEIKSQVFRRIYDTIEELNIWLKNNINFINVINICASGTGIGDCVNIFYTLKDGYKVE